MNTDSSKRHALFNKEIESEYDRFVQERRQKELKTLRESIGKRGLYFRSSSKPRRDDE